MAQIARHKATNFPPNLAQKLNDHKTESKNKTARMIDPMTIHKIQVTMRTLISEIQDCNKLPRKLTMITDKTLKNIFIDKFTINNQSIPDMEKFARYYPKIENNDTTNIDK